MNRERGERWSLLCVVKREREEVATAGKQPKVKLPRRQGAKTHLVAALRLAPAARNGSSQQAERWADRI